MNSVKWLTASLEQAEAWVKHLEATRDVPNTLASMVVEWKKNKEFVRCVGTQDTFPYTFSPNGDMENGFLVK